MQFSGGGIQLPPFRLGLRHGRAWPGHPRLFLWDAADVDARDKPGHDGL